MSNVDQVSPEVMTSMREWAKECQWAESENDPYNEWIDDLSDEEVLTGIDNRYCGGTSQFVEDVNA